MALRDLAEWERLYGLDSEPVKSLDDWERSLGLAPEAPQFTPSKPFQIEPELTPSVLVDETPVPVPRGVTRSFDSPEAVPEPGIVDRYLAGMRAEGIPATAGNVQQQPPAITKGFVTGLFQQNPQAAGETAEALGYLTGSDYLKGVGKSWQAASVDPRFAPSGVTLEEAGQSVEKALTWAGETVGQGLASTLPAVAGGLALAPLGPAGMLAGATLPSFAMNYGDLYRSLKDEGAKPEDAARIALAPGAVITSLDVAGLGTIASVFKGAARKQAMRGLARRLITASAKGMLAESSTESYQQMIQESVLEEQSPGTVPLEKRAMNVAQAGLAGAMVGGLMAGPAGVRTPQVAKPPAPAVPVTDQTAPAKVQEAIPPSAPPQPGQAIAVPPEAQPAPDVEALSVDQRKALVAKIQAADLSPRDWITATFGKRTLTQLTQADLTRANAALDALSVPAAKAPEVTAVKEPWQLTLREIEESYPTAGTAVDGRVVREDIPNEASIDASVDNPTVLPGIREVPMSVFTLTGKSYSADENTRIANLAERIKESGEISPLIVVVDEKGPYILEGGHRADALHLLGAKSFPALVVLDEDALHGAAKEAVASGKPVPDAVLAEYPDLARKAPETAPGGAIPAGAPSTPVPAAPAPAAAPATPAVTVAYRENPEKRSVELEFSKDPGDETKNALKRDGWVFTKALKVWHREDTPEARTAGRAVADRFAPAPVEVAKGVPDQANEPVAAQGVAIVNEPVAAEPIKQTKPRKALGGMREPVAAPVAAPVPAVAEPAPVHQARTPEEIRAILFPTQEEGQPQTLGEMLDAVPNLASFVTVVPDHTALPQHILDEAKDRGHDLTGVEGVYSQGRVYLNQAKMTTPGAARGLIAHEIAVHHGLKTALGTEGFSELAKHVYANLSKQEQADITRRAKIRQGDGPELAGEEWLAYEARRVIEQGKTNPFWKKVAARVNPWLRDRGFRRRYNDVEIAQLVEKGWNAAVTTPVAPRVQEVVEEAVPEVQAAPVAPTPEGKISIVPASVPLDPEAVRAQIKAMNLTTPGANEWLFNALDKGTEDPRDLLAVAQDVQRNERKDARENRKLRQAEQEAEKAIQTRRNKAAKGPPLWKAVLSVGGLKPAEIKRVIDRTGVVDTKAAMKYLGGVKGRLSLEELLSEGWNSDLGVQLRQAGVRDAEDVDGLALVLANPEKMRARYVADEAQVGEDLYAEEELKALKRGARFSAALEKAKQARKQYEDQALPMDLGKRTVPTAALPSAGGKGLEGTPLAGAVEDEKQAQAAGEQTSLFSISPPTKESVAAFADDTKKRLGLGTFQVFLTNQGDLELAMIEVPRGQRKQGIGTRAIEELTRFADQHGRRIILSPGLKDTRSGTTSRSRLVNFYRRQGFVLNRGRNTDYSISSGMYRPPQSGKEGARFSADRVTQEEIDAAANRPDIDDLLIEWWDNSIGVSDDLRSNGPRSGDYREPPSYMQDMSRKKQREFVLWLRDLDKTRFSAASSQESPEAIGRKIGAAIRANDMDEAVRLSRLAHQAEGPDAGTWDEYATDLIATVAEVFPDRAEAYRQKLTAAPVVPVDEPPPGMKRSQYAGTLEDAGLPAGTNTFYEPLTHEETERAAKKRVKQGVDVAEAWLRTPVEMPTAEHQAVAAILIANHQWQASEYQQQAEATTDPQEKKDLEARSQAAFDKAIGIASYIVPLEHKAGQFIEAAKLTSRIDPAGIILWAERRIEALNRKPGGEPKPKSQQRGPLTKPESERLQKKGGELREAVSLGTLVEEASQITGKIAAGQQLTPEDLTKVNEILGQVGEKIQQPKKTRGPKPGSEQAILETKWDARKAAALDRLRKAGKAPAARFSVESEEFDARVEVGVANMVHRLTKYDAWVAQMTKDLGPTDDQVLRKVFRESRAIYLAEARAARKLSGQTKYIAKALERAQGVMAGTEQPGVMPDMRVLGEAVDALKGASTELQVERSMEINQLIGMLEKPSLLRKISTVQTAMQLLNPKTTVTRNPLGNEILYRVNRLAHGLASGMDYARVKVGIGPKERVITYRTGGQEFGFWRGFMRGGRLGWKGLAPGGLATQFELEGERGPAFRGKGWTQQAIEKVTGKKTDAAINLPAYMEKSLGATLRSFDYAAYMRARGATIGELAELEADRQGITDKDQRGAFISHYAQTAAANEAEIAHQAGRWMTFQDDSEIGKALSATKRGLNLGKDWGAGDVFLKYPKTPGNLLDRAVSFSPAGILRSIYILRNGEGPIMERTRAGELELARALVGSAGLSGLGAYLFVQGALTARPPKDREAEEFIAEETGQRDSQINLSAVGRWFRAALAPLALKPRNGDQLYSWDWAQPVAINIAIGSNIAQALSKSRESGVLSAVGEGLAQGMRTIEEQPVLQGVTNVAKAVAGAVQKGKSWPAAVITSGAQQVPASFVPTLLNQLRTAQDNTRRVTYAKNPLKQALNRAIAKVPFMAEELPPQRQTYGGEIVKTFEPTGSVPGDLFQIFLSPGFLNTFKMDPEIAAIIHPYEETGETTQFPRKISPKVTVSVKMLNARWGGLNAKKSYTYELSGDELSAFQGRMGQTVEKLMDDTTRNPAYRGKLPSEQLKALAGANMDAFAQTKEWFLKRYAQRPDLGKP